MGRSGAYEPLLSHEVFVAARGAAHCTILQVPVQFPHKNDRSSGGGLLKAKLKLTFAEMLYHVAASPHVEAELAFVTGDGLVHWWEPESGVQTLSVESTMASERLLHCEYASHPCVLWTANRFTVRSVDLREKPKALAQYDKLFDLAIVGSPLAEIYDIKRRSRSVAALRLLCRGNYDSLRDCHMSLHDIVAVRSSWWSVRACRSRWSTAAWPCSRCSRGRSRSPSATRRRRSERLKKWICPRTPTSVEVRSVSSRQCWDRHCELTWASVRLGFYRSIYSP